MVESWVRMFMSDKNRVAFPYSEWRPGQREAAELLAKTVREGGVFVLNAPTGFGKTATVIYGLLEAGADKVLYLVRTRNEIIPVLRELHRFKQDKILFLYSARRMCPIFGAKDVEIEEFWDVCKLLRIQGKCKYYSRLAETNVDDVEEIVSRSTTPFQTVKVLAKRGLCPFYALRMLIGRSSFIVATYPYLFNKEIFNSTFEPLSYSDFHIVVDEAHNLLNIQSILEARISQEDIKHILEELKKYDIPSSVVDKVKEFYELIDGLSAEARGMLRISLEKLRSILGDPKYWDNVAFDVYTAHIQELLKGSNDERILLKPSILRLKRIASLAYHDNAGAYVTVDRKGSKIVVVTVLDPCVLTEEPFNAAKSVVLLSGTMPPQDYIRNILCIKNRNIVVYDVEEAYLEASYEPSYTVLTLELTSKYTSRSNTMYMLYAQYIIEAYKLLSKSMLVVYPSYEFMANIVSVLADMIGHEKPELIVEGRTTTLDDVMARIETRKSLVNIVAGGKLAEGVEFKSGSMGLVGLVFIAGLPYPQPDDYLEDVLKLLLLRFESPNASKQIYDYLAVLRTRQSIGRAKRSPWDRVVVVLGDYRFLRTSIRRQLRMRIDRIVSDIEEYKSVLAEVTRQLEL